MGNITLCRDYVSDVTIVNNVFIDRYMCDANDAQIKIYLYLLRHIDDDSNICVSAMADFFNYTEKDVLRALKHWDKKNVISLSFNSSGSLTCIQLLDLSIGRQQATKYSDESYVSETDSAELIEDKKYSRKTDIKHEIKDTVKVVDFSDKPNYSVEELIEFKNKPEISQLLFVAETYLAKTLRPGEISSILFMYDTYGFSTDLIEYLIEYCVNNKKKNIKYIETVAKNWAETGITTVEEAQARTCNAPREVYEVFKAFGIQGRSPIEPEISYVFKWMNVYGMNIEIICEACNRTIMSTHSASFEYTDSILYNWKEAGVTDIKDIVRLDEQHSKKSQRRTSPAKPRQERKTATVNSSFNSFSQRKYDYAELERDALSN